jgi:hypothetical protein
VLRLLTDTDDVISHPPPVVRRAPVKARRAIA